MFCRFGSAMYILTKRYDTYIYVYLASKGILLGVSPPYQHEKNDKAERIHKPPRRLATVLLHAGHLPVQMWAKAHSMALYIINITPKGGTGGRISP